MTAVDHPAIVLAQLGGRTTTGQLAAVCGRRAVEAAIQVGAVKRVGRGRLVLPELDQALSAAHGVNGVLALRSAAQAYGWPVLRRPEAPEIFVPRKRCLDHGRRVGLSIGWRELADEEMSRGVTDPLRTVVDCAKQLPFNEALAVADSALRVRAVSASDLTGVSVNGRGAARVRRVVDQATPLAANPFESALRAIAVEAVGDRFRAQCPVKIALGSVIHPDLGDPIARIALEADSFQHHGHRAALHSDCWRYDELVVARWRVLRFAWEQVMFESDWVRACIRALYDDDPIADDLWWSDRRAA